MIILKFIPQNIKLDNVQLSIVKFLENEAISLNVQTYLRELIDRFKGKQKPKGIYLHGGVGRGKTLLMKAFFERINIPKEIIHYQNFMQYVHTTLHKMKNKHTNTAIEELASDIASRVKVLCLDEFEIKDITDAMIIMRLFKYLLDKKVYIFLTTNTLAEDLYKDGIQRESFLPFIKMIQHQFMILHLDSNIDYRFLNISEAGNRVLYPMDKKTIEEIERVKQRLCADIIPIPINIEVFGRKILFKKTHKETLFTNFSELFEQELGYVDYINICQQFQIIIVEGVREIKEAETDLIIRFINFVDNAYFYKILLFITLDKAPEEIYKKGKRIQEYKRIISRLKEMNNPEYLKMEQRNEF